MMMFLFLGTFVLVLVALIYFLSTHSRNEKLSQEAQKEDDEDVRVDRMGLSKRAEDVLKVVMDAPMLQNDLPGELEVSKATVSNAVSELFDRNLVKKKKKANTYLIEPKMDEIEEQAR